MNAVVFYQKQTYMLQGDPFDYVISQGKQEI